MLKIATITPKIKIASPTYNAKICIDFIRKMQAKDVDIVIFPLSTFIGHTSYDLKSNEDLQCLSEEALYQIIHYSYLTKDMVIIVNLPHMYVGGKLTTHTYVIQNGGTIRIIIDDPNSPWLSHRVDVKIGKGSHSLGIYYDKIPRYIDGETAILFRRKQKYVWDRYDLLKKEVLCDLRENKPVIVVGLSMNESCDDFLYSSSKAFIKNKKICAYDEENEVLIFDADKSEKTDCNLLEKEDYKKDERNSIFLPEDEFLKDKFCKEALDIQVNALINRLLSIDCKNVVLGLSGGLDSALALIVCVLAFDKLKIDRKNIHTYLLPAFGSSKKTMENAELLAKGLNVSFETIDLNNIVREHLSLINQPKENDDFKMDVVYENAQARMRTLFLMDLANMKEAIVVGTGDLSEIALGYCTFNADHMSMFNVNAGIPKSTIKFLIRRYLKLCFENEEVKNALESIINTTISPELLPPDKDGNISQSTEEIVGKYELIDYFIYKIVKEKQSISRVYDSACKVFCDIEKDSIKKYLIAFVKRFFGSSFKRQSQPSGVMIFDISLSQRKGFIIPSEAKCDEIISELEKMESD